MNHVNIKIRLFLRALKRKYYHFRFVRQGNIYRFQKIADFYRGGGHYFYLHGELPNEDYLSKRTGLSLEEWVDNERAIKMLEKYWISDEEYENHWSLLREMIFKDLSLNEMINTPEKVFSSNWITKGFEAGCVFGSEGEFESLRESLIGLGEKEMVIIEENPPEGPFPIKLNLPLSMKWDDVLRGGYLLFSILKQDYGNYYVYGSIPEWGMYVATESANMMNLISFSPKIGTYVKKQEQTNP